MEENVLIKQTISGNIGFVSSLRVVSVLLIVLYHSTSINA